jgi:3-hydroxyacyl-CoA dehydrogenase/enoyl-CoA hydratase/3-hydroxybutyryl-CoA epimerase
VGIDVGAKVAEQMAQAFGARMRAPGSMAGLLEDGRQGRKNRRGFYRYRGVEGRRRGVDASVYAAVGAMPDPAREPDGVAERCVLLMVNEAVRCFQERVLRSARDGDVAAVFGLGFPPFLGGPLRYVDHLTPGALADRLHALADRHGERFEPAGLLRDMAADGTTFHGERAILPR